MKYYKQFLDKECFSYSDAIKIIGNENLTKQILRDYISKGYIQKVRRGLYVAINLYDDEPVANKFLIASKITSYSYISHHSAFDYHGVVNQVSQEICVSSDTKFNNFSYNGFVYRYIPSASKLGVMTDEQGILYTDIERTVVDMINNFENHMGFEELIKCISAIPYLNESKILKYLTIYNKNFLYQKIGFIFSHYKNKFHLSNKFFNICKQNIGKSSRYLLKNSYTNDLVFNKEWALIIPRNLWFEMEGCNVNAGI